MCTSPLLGWEPPLPFYWNLLLTLQRTRTLSLKEWRKLSCLELKPVLPRPGTRQFRTPTALDELMPTK